MKLKLLLVALFTTLLLPTATRAESLYDFLIDTTGRFPTVEERKPLAKSCNIYNYSGTALQNIALLACIKEGLPEAQIGEGMLGGTVTKPNTFSPNTTIRSSEINANFDTLYTLVNGNIDNDNIDSSAAIVRTKIDGTAIVSTGVAAQTIFSTTTIEGGLFVSSTVNYFRVPLMTTAQRAALTNLQNGAIIYNTSSSTFNVYEAGAWTGITPTAVTALASLTGKGVAELATGAEAAASAAAGSGSTDAALILHTGIATSSPVAAGNFVVITTSTGKIDAAFGGVTSSLATLNANALVVQDPANATSTPGANLIPRSNASGTLAAGWLPRKFGGTGVDGAYAPTAGVTTTLDALNQNVFVKNYTSINIPANSTTTITNASTTGSILIMKSQGNCTIAGNIDLVGFGGQPGIRNQGASDDVVHYGVSEVGGLIYTNRMFYTTGHSSSTYTKMIVVAAGAAGATGDSGVTNTGGQGGGGGASFDSAGALGSNGGVSGGAGTAGVAGTSGAGGSGGGSGGGANDVNVGTGGLGGNGGGAFILECAGTLTFTGQVNVSGANGTIGNNGTGGGGGGGGGGSSGMAALLADTVGTNTGTFITKGGAGGNGGNGNGGGGGGAGGAASGNSPNHARVIRNTDLW